MTKSLLLPLLLILISSLYFYTATARAILDDGDALYAHVAREMVERGDWVTPYANGVRFLDKPPMMYWLMGLSYRIFGTSEFAARAPSIFGVIGVALVVYFIGKKMGGTASGFVAGLASSFSVGTFLFTRMVFPDMIFVFFLTLSLGSFLVWYTHPTNPALPVMVYFGSLAAAMLTKGLIGVLFPLLIVVVFLLLMGDWARLKHFHIGKGVLLFVALALPWHVLVAMRNTGFLWYFFVNEQFLRFLGRRQPVDYESLSAPVFWALIPLWFFPWSAFLPAIRHTIQRRGVGPAETRAAVWLSLTWVLVIAVFFSFSSRIEHYALPLFPPLALLVGLAVFPGKPYSLPVHEGWQRSVSRGFGLLGIGGVVLALAILAARASAWRPDQSGQGAASHLHSYKHFFAPLYDLPSDVLERLQIPLTWAALAVSAGFLCAWALDKTRRRMMAITVLSITMTAFSLSAYHSLGICEELLSSRQFARALNRQYGSGDQVIVVGDYETANSLNFYLTAELYVYGGTAAVLEWGLRYPDAPSRILSRAELESRWKSPRRVFVLCPDPLISSLSLGNPAVVLCSSGRTLLCNQSIE